VPRIPAFFRDLTLNVQNFGGQDNFGLTIAIIDIEGNDQGNADIEDHAVFHLGMFISGGARVKPSKVNPGETVQLTKVNSPVLRAACQ
tara:strand:- start:21 stop:284 length:264 start_codon:yes stop_codon:yes gene_type:complete